MPVRWRLGVSANGAAGAGSIAIATTLLPLRDASGKIAHIACWHEDVTAASASLGTTTKEERFRCTFEQAAVGIAHLTPSGTWLEVNDRWCEIAGYTRQELLALTFQDIYYAPEPNEHLELLEGLLSGRLGQYAMETRYLRKGGRVVCVDLTMSLVRNTSGEPDYLMAVIQDASARVAASEALAENSAGLEAEILKRRDAENLLRQSEESLAATLHSIGDGVITTDTSGRVARMNPAAQALTGWPLESAKGNPLREIFHLFDEETRHPVENPAERVLRDGTVVGLANHTLLIARDGSERAIADSAAPIRDLNGTVRGVVLVFRDQTEQRTAERALEESEARKGAILEAALDSIVCADSSGSITEFNPAAEKTFGYRRATVVGRPLVQLLIPESFRARHTAGFNEYLASGHGPILGKRLELPALRADGTEFPAELAVVAIQSLAGPMFTAYIRDISEQRRAREALEVSEARFRHLAESGIIGIIVADMAGSIHEANDAFLQIVGFSRQELLSGRVGWADLTPPEWREMDQHAVAEIRATGIQRPREKQYRRKDGSLVPVLVCAAMLSHELCLGVVLDLSDRQRARDRGAQAEQTAREASAHRERAEEALRQTEQQLRQSQKMEAIGALTGSIAHDFNNLLSVILSYSTLMLADSQLAEPMRADLEEIAAAGKRAGELTQQLLAFSRQQVLQPCVVNLNEAISGMGRMLERLIGEDVELVIALEARPGAVFVDPSQVDQVLLNLVINAREAMPQGGVLTLATVDVEIDEHEGRALDAAPGAYVSLSVTDTGSGMDSATRARIFEPFFTTKPKGKGTGLGLSTVFGIVKQSGGSIAVSSSPAVGTTFNVYLPRARRSSASSERVRADANPGTGTETILLVEDNEQVRTLASSILRRNGYRVVEAATGGDALLISEEHSGPLDLLLTDVVMPRMSGRELWERLSPLRPAAKVLYMSGYTDDAVVRRGVLTADTSFIQKPITPGLLLAKVREVLDKN